MPDKATQLTGLLLKTAVSAALFSTVALRAAPAGSTPEAATEPAPDTSQTQPHGLSIDPFQTLVYDPLFAVSKPLGNIDPIGQYLKEPLERAVPQLSIKGYIQNLTEVNLTSNQTTQTGRTKDWTLQKEEWRFNLDTKFRVNDSITIGTVFGFQYDGAYSWQSSNGLTANQIDRDAEYYNSFDRVAREIWVQYDTGPLSLKVGRQQIVWGKMDGKILDIIDPDDRRDGPAYTQSDYEWRRIPLTAVNATYRISDSTIIQGVWVPEFRPVRGTLPGSPYSYVDAAPGARETPNNSPDQFSISDSAGGGRIDTTVGALTLSGIYYYGWDYAGAAGVLSDGSPFTHYARTNNVGAAADYGTKLLGHDVTLRAESIYINGLKYSDGSVTGDQWSEKDQIKSAVALETSIGSAGDKVNLMFQPFWIHNIDPDRRTFGDAIVYVFNASYSVRATGDRLSFDTTLYPETVDSNYQGLGWNIGANWRFSQWITARAYYWNFSGPGGTAYGVYDKFDVFGLQLKYEF